MCNACGLFFKLHGVVWPPSLKTDLIKKRNRAVEEVPVFLRQRPGDSVSERRYSPCRFVKPAHTISDTSPRETRTATALSAVTLLTACTQQCAIVVRRLEALEKSDHGEMAGLMLSLSLSVVELRLRLWGQIASGFAENLTVYRSSSIYPLQTLVKINGIICELGVVVNISLWDTQPEVCDTPLSKCSGNAGS